MTSKSPVGDISVVTLIRTDTTLDHSQKAEKVCHTLFGSSDSTGERDGSNVSACLAELMGCSQKHWFENARWSWFHMSATGGHPCGRGNDTTSDA